MKHTETTSLPDRCALTDAVPTTNVAMTVAPSETNTAPNLAIRLPSEDRPPPPHHYEPVTSIGETDAITGTGGLTTTRARIRR